MFRMKYLIFIPALFSNAFSKHIEDVIYFEDEVPTSRQSNTILTDIASQFFNPSLRASQVLDNKNIYVKI